MLVALRKWCNLSIMNRLDAKFVVVVAAKFDDAFLLLHIFLDFKNAVQFTLECFE